MVVVRQNTDSLSPLLFVVFSIVQSTFRVRDVGGWGLHLSFSSAFICNQNLARPTGFYLRGYAPAKGEGMRM